jgi:hypothetical protein
MPAPAPGPGAPEGAPGAAERRRYLVAVLLCLAGSALAAYAATRTWSVDVVPRGGGLSELRTTRTGADASPWLPALGVVGLAGAGALLATRGAVRRAIGVLLMAAGLVVPVLALAAAVGLWPLLCALGGLAVVAAGALAVAYGHRWPAMGARYERRPDGQRPGADPTRSAWEALDRGEDPTSS